MTKVNEHSLEYIEGYYRGFVAALESYAWWGSGIQYVGSGNYRLSEALEEAKKGRQEKLDEMNLLAFGVHPPPIKLRGKE